MFIMVCSWENIYTNASTRPIKQSHARNNKQIQLPVQISRNTETFRQLANGTENGPHLFPNSDLTRIDYSRS